ncbi:response regulator transcription factor [Dyadobacter sp. CY323]|uniref:response regulator transcription factor n=1 Tax=Dyadobacter sp. CY323 TaxID=2907302 RepID=UPI001F341D47|nr:response regulator transcription factor [Dyadobacter sp. CY323]MCE6991943.1 response regulator transcription factor [Dyadobacter sp. CY323]
MQIKLLIADDHPIFLKGLAEVIETDPDLKVVFSAKNGQEALLNFQLQNVDLVVLDIDMPLLTGLEAAEKMLKIRSDLPIIILTMHKEKAPFMKSLEIGVMGYVLKENAVSDIVHAIYKVAGGDSYLSPEISSYLLKKSIALNKHTKSDLKDLLTPSETQIVKLIAEYKTSKEIADELFISEKTVFNHRMNISKKLNLTGKNSLLRFALDHW